MGDGEPRDVEGASQVDVQHLLPLLRIDLFERGRGAADARVINEHVEPAQLRKRRRYRSFDRRTVRDVAHIESDAGALPGQCVQRTAVDVADMDPRTGFGKGDRNRPADSRGPAVTNTRLSRKSKSMANAAQ